MFFVYPSTIPANAPASPTQFTLAQVSPGTVKKVEIQFPSGCAGLVSVWILRGLTQVWPLNPDKQFIADGETISFDEDYPMLQGPFEFRIFFANLDDTYAHTVTVRLQITPPSALQSLSAEIAALLKGGG